MDFDIYKLIKDLSNKRKLFVSEADFQLELAWLIKHEYPDSIVRLEYYNLKNHSAKDVNCYAYLKDIQRIESVKKNVSFFKEGYTVFLTNDLTYTKKPSSERVNYYEFSIHQKAIKHGKMDWGEKTSEGTKGRNYKYPIVLDGKYEMNWNDYSKIDSTDAGTFKFLVNSIL